MRKDLRSYLAHNEEYESDPNSIENNIRLIKMYQNIKLFETLGFERALNNFDHRDLHVDLGSGTGWLINETAPKFKLVIGVEQSTAAIKTSESILAAHKNILYVNKDMVEWTEKKIFTKPVFFTSAMVFSHIKDHYVTKLLTNIDSSPLGSTLYFNENYDTNIHQPLWHIRNKSWWAKRLPNWQLTFFQIPNDVYISGIYGERVGRENVIEKYNLSLLEKIGWHISGIKNKIYAISKIPKYIIRKIYK